MIIIIIVTFIISLVMISSHVYFTMFKYHMCTENSMFTKQTNKIDWYRVFVPPNIDHLRHMQANQSLNQIHLILIIWKLNYAKAKLSYHILSKCVWF